MTEPTLRLLSLGAGVQSTALAVMSAEGLLPKLDAAIFADTRWEPARVYNHLDRLEQTLTNAGIPLYRVSGGDLRADVLNPNKMRSIPAYTASKPYEVTVVDQWGPCPDESCGWRALRRIDHIDSEQERLFPVDLFDLASDLDHATIDVTLQACCTCHSEGRIPTVTHTEIRRDFGMLGRKCTQQYKLRPILEQVRLLLGATAGEEKPCRYCDGGGERVAPWRAKRGEAVVAECSVCDGLGTISRVGQPPAGRWAEQWIGFSVDEIGRVSNRGDTRYSRSRYPLLELEMSRQDCEAFLAARGIECEKSACNGCPFHGNKAWRQMRDNDPESWADAVQFDREYRVGAGMRQERFLHISCLPLDRAPIDVVRPSEWVQGDLGARRYDLMQAEEGSPDGCSPWACRSGVAA